MAQASLDPEWMQNCSTKTKAFFKDLLQIHDRPENQDIEIPPEVSFLREWKSVEQMVREIHSMEKKDHERRETWHSAGKQAVLLFLSKVGWK